MCQLEPGSVASMRIKALDLLDSPPPNRDDEIDEISVPFGLAPAEQIVRPERTNSQSRVMRHTRDLRSIFRGLVLSELVQTVSKRKDDSAILEQRTRLFFVCQSSSGVARAEQTRCGRPLQPQAPPASYCTLIRCPDERPQTEFSRHKSAV
jgi:hypothetical protein